MPGPNAPQLDDLRELLERLESGPMSFLRNRMEAAKREAALVRSEVATLKRTVADIKLFARNE